MPTTSSFVTEATKRLKNTLALNGENPADYTFYRSADYISFYAVGKKYCLTTGTTALGKTVHSIQPYPESVWARLIKLAG